MVTNHKEILRKQTLTNLKNMSTEQRVLEEEILLEKLLNHIEENQYQNIGLYYGIYPELNLPSIFQKLTNNSLYLPRMLPKRKLAFHLYQGEENLEATWNDIQQPTANTPMVAKENLDLIVVPGLAFMPNGFRIGFGGGYYDRFLSGLSVPTLSVIFSVQLYPLNEWEEEIHDIPIQNILTVSKGDLNGNKNL